MLNLVKKANKQKIISSLEINFSIIQRFNGGEAVSSILANVLVEHMETLPLELLFFRRKISGRCEDHAFFYFGRIPNGDTERYKKKQRLRGRWTNMHI